jgi:hypothetical protein
MKMQLKMAVIKNKFKNIDEGKGAHLKLICDDIARSTNDIKTYTLAAEDPPPGPEVLELALQSLKMLPITLRLKLLRLTTSLT